MWTCAVIYSNWCQVIGVINWQTPCCAFFFVAGLHVLKYQSGTSLPRHAQDQTLLQAALMSQKKLKNWVFKLCVLWKTITRQVSWQWKFCAKGNQKHQPHIQQTPPDTCSWHLINTSSTKMWDLNFLLNALGPTKIFLQLLWRSSTRCRRGEQ